MTMEMIVALLLAVATLFSCARLVLWQRSSGQGASGRLVLLLLLQPLVSALLYFALFPPAIAGGASRLRIATAGASRLATTPDGTPLLRLPEAPGSGEAIPDLATALRRRPGVAAITVLGDGLTPRDIDAASGLSVAFDPAPLRPGIVDLAAPSLLAPGAGFTLGGTLTGLPGATVELLDPAGRLTDTGGTDADGHFLLRGTARAAGSASFVLRVRKDKRVVEQATVPVWVEAGARTRLLILAGAPGPEVKYLRRWAGDAGFDVTTRMSAGGGIALGDAPVPIDAAGLRRFDMAIVDERSWPGARGALMTAVRGGLGLVLRAGGAIDGTTRSQWQALGFGLAGENGLAPLPLPRPPADAIARTRHGIGNDDAPLDIASPDEILPDISRLNLTPGGNGAVPLLRDAGGGTIAAWRAVGAGRLALFTVIDSYGLTLTGRRDLHDDWWSALLATVARPATAARVETQVMWTGERMTLCGLAGDTRVEAPDGSAARLLPVAGCGAFWPERSGWHRVSDKNGLRLFYVRASGDLPVMRAARDRMATALLASASTPMQPSPATAEGDAWPWWLGWLGVSGLLWWLERSRIGRAAPVQSAT